MKEPPAELGAVALAAMTGSAHRAALGLAGSSFFEEVSV
jgi:hypothetical protein